MRRLLFWLSSLSERAEDFLATSLSLQIIPSRLLFLLFIPDQAGWIKGAETPQVIKLGIFSYNLMQNQFRVAVLAILSHFVKLLELAE